MSPNHLWFYEVTLAPEAESISTARQFVRGHLDSHDLPLLVDDMTLVASELATNAVAHAGTPFTVSLTALVGTVILAVKDGSALRPIRMDPHLLDATGRGVAIVDFLSREWGVSSHPYEGKSVWAAFDAG